MNIHFWMDLLRHGASSLAALWLQPFLYVSIVLILLHYRGQMMDERQMFGVRLHGYGKETWNRVWTGALVGLAASAAMLALGAALRPETLALVWLVSLLAVWLRFRFLCMAYATGVAGVLYGIVSIPGVADGLSRIGLGAVADWLLAIELPSLLAVVGVLHLAEALLVGWTGERAAMPVFFEGKRGKPIGVYRLQQYWPVPLLLLAPAPAAGATWMFGLVGASSTPLPWEPLLGGGSWASGWWLLPFPVLIGFGSMTLSRLPGAAARENASRIAIYGILVLGMALLAAWLPVAAVPAALLALLLHEVLIRLDGWLEARKQPLYVHDERGLKVLAVLPGSAAEAMVIAPGEVVRKVNGLQVRTRAELHAALRENPAFCKLEVLDLQGEVRFLSRTLYAGQHHQLGLVLCPDAEAPYMAVPGPTGLWALLRTRRARRGGGKPAGSEAAEL